MSARYNNNTFSLKIKTIRQYNPLGISSENKYVCYAYNKCTNKCGPFGDFYTCIQKCANRFPCV